MKKMIAVIAACFCCALVSLALAQPAQDVNEMRAAAEGGDARAQHNLGLYYALGRGGPEDDVQAVAWYRKSAEQGYAAAQSALGVMYRSGRGVAHDNSQAVEWFRCAPKARIASGGGFHPESCRFDLVAIERIGWVTARFGASRQKAA